MWRSAIDIGKGPDAAPVLERVRQHLAHDLRTPEALDAVDAWAQAALDAQGEDPSAPALISATTDALLGIRL
jgi:L-cysteine:1D-myo-inositol 2-amino-2-deoxy-alpha-D-glucopyranoside ligase